MINFIFLMVAVFVLASCFQRTVYDEYAHTPIAGWEKNDTLSFEIPPILTTGYYQEKTVITVVGKDGVGIIAKVCNYLASNNVNILDISQTITGGFFNMMMVVDPAGSSKDIALLSSELKQIGEEIGVVIQAQNERIFDIMHRI